MSPRCESDMALTGSGSLSCALNSAMPAVTSSTSAARCSANFSGGIRPLARAIMSSMPTRTSLVRITSLPTRARICAPSTKLAGAAGSGTSRRPADSPGLAVPVGLLAGLVDRPVGRSGAWSDRPDCPSAVIGGVGPPENSSGRWRYRLARARPTAGSHETGLYPFWGLAIGTYPPGGTGGKGLGPAKPPGSTPEDRD